MTRWLWYGVAYSFLGFLLEVAYAYVIQHPKKDRKCCCFLPLCPVYGLGAVAVLALPRWVSARWPLLWLVGGLTATAVEYLLALFYEKTLFVRFWDYSAIKGNVHGRVCLPFALVWGGLAVAGRYFLHPWVAAAVDAIPPSWTLPAVAVLTLDAYFTLAALSATGRTESLRWYARLKPALTPEGSRSPSAGGETRLPER